MAQRDTIAFQDINAELDAWYSALAGEKRERMLNVISDPAKEDDSVTVELELFQGPQRGKRFRIVSACEGLDDIQLDESKVKIEIIPSDDGSRPEISPGRSRVKKGEKIIETPLSNIPEDEIKNILVYSDLCQLDSKLGEMVINLWPLVTELNKKYPDAVIYVSARFPDIFFAKQFKGRIKPMPRSEEDIRDWEYDINEWKDYTVEQMSEADGRERGSKRWKGFLNDKKIDMVFGMFPSPLYFSHMSPEDFPHSRPPHVILTDSLAQLNSAQEP
ncbi:MAG: hypothetical protein U9R44_06515, partial [Candidatus Omnitrophota bacterium]|nr:hypothetical protein [Candidatus Omnitrophota bacterium]